MSKQNSQTTRPVLKAMQQGEYLASSILTQEPEVTQALNDFSSDRIPPGGEGEPITDWRANQMTNHRMMLQANDTVLNSDLVFRYARADVRAGVAEAKDRTLVPQNYYSDLVLMVEGAYGKEYLYIFGLDAARARGLLPVREQLRDVQGRMADPARLAMLPVPKPGRLGLDFATIVEGIKTILADFEVFLEKRKEQAKILQAASIARNEALEDHRRIYVNIARVQEGWYRLAGLDELANRLRAFARGRRAAEPTELTEPTEPTEPTTTSNPCLSTVLDERNI